MSSGKRLLTLIEAVLRGGPRGSSIAHLAERTGIDDSTAARLLATAVDAGWVVRDRDKRFRPGAQVLSIASSVGHSSAIQQAILAVLGDLRSSTGETCAYQQLVGTSRVMVVGLESQHELRRGLPAGQVLPLHIGAAGRAMLAHLDAVTAKAVLEAAPDDLDNAALDGDIATVRRTGILHSQDARHPGVSGACSPVFDVSGINGAVVVSGPTSRFDLAARQAAEPAIRNAAQRVTALLGGASPTP